MEDWMFGPPLLVGDRTLYRSDEGYLLTGMVRWLGRLPKEFGQQMVVGVELDQSITGLQRTCDGHYGNRKLFKCRPGTGVFAVLPRLQKLDPNRCNNVSISDSYEEEQLEERVSGKEKVPPSPEARKWSELTLEQIDNDHEKAEREIDLIMQNMERKMEAIKAVGEHNDKVIKQHEEEEAKEKVYDEAFHSSGTLPVGGATTLKQESGAARESLMQTQIELLNTLRRRVDRRPKTPSNKTTLDRASFVEMKSPRPKFEDKQAPDDYYEEVVVRKSPSPPPRAQSARKKPLPRHASASSALKSAVAREKFMAEVEKASAKVRATQLQEAKKIEEEPHYKVPVSPPRPVSPPKVVDIRPVTPKIATAVTRAVQPVHTLPNMSKIPPPPTLSIVNVRRYESSLRRSSSKPELKPKPKICSQNKHENVSSCKAKETVRQETDKHPDVLQKADSALDKESAFKADIKSTQAPLTLSESKVFQQPSKVPAIDKNASPLRPTPVVHSVVVKSKDESSSPSEKVPKADNPEKKLSSCKLLLNGDISKPIAPSVAAKPSFEALSVEPVRPQRVQVEKASGGAKIKPPSRLFVVQNNSPAPFYGAKKKTVTASSPMKEHASNEPVKRDEPLNLAGPLPAQCMPLGEVKSAQVVPTKLSSSKALLEQKSRPISSDDDLVAVDASLVPDQVGKNNRTHDALPSEKNGPALERQASTSSSTGKPSPSEKKAHGRKGDMHYTEEIEVSLYVEDKTSHHGPIKLKIPLNINLGELKLIVERRFEVPAAVQRWIIGKNLVTDDAMLLRKAGITKSGDEFGKPSNEEANEKAEKKTEEIKEVAEEEPAKVVPKNRYWNFEKNRWSICALSDEEDEDEAPREDANKHNAAAGAAALKKDQPDGEATEGAGALEEKPKGGAKESTFLQLEKLDALNVIPNVEAFQCKICFMDYEPGDGVVLRECLHIFCRECLKGTIEFSDSPTVKCPYKDDDYSCDMTLLDREVRELVSQEVYEKLEKKSLQEAQASAAQNSFHCKTPDCKGWCFITDEINSFSCPICKRLNCITCQAIHEGMDCRQYQQYSLKESTDENSKKTQEWIEGLVKTGDALHCPNCQVLLLKKWGCDWVRCTYCRTEICWVTKQLRWGPNGRGDTSGGCKCMADGRTKCHPNCNYCH